MTQSPTPSDQERLDETLTQTAPQLEEIATQTLADEVAGLEDATRDDTW